MASSQDTLETQASKKTKKSGKFKYKVKAGLHQEDGITYGVGEEAGDTFFTDRDLQNQDPTDKKRIPVDQYKDKFELLGVSE